MTVRGHPDPSILISYASGTLPSAISGVVSCHASMCPQCAEDLRKLEMLGGLLLERCDPAHYAENFEEDLAKNVLERSRLRLGLDTAPAPEALHDPVLPSPLVRYLGSTADQIPWRKLPKGVRQYWIDLPKGSGYLRLLKVPAGLQLLEHSHRGMELMLILQGIYSDHTGDYAKGEVSQMQNGTAHHPRITSEEECICLIATEELSCYKSCYASLLQPLLGY